MALPSGFHEPSDYFQQCLQFLDEFSWIYSSSNTQFIKEGILDRLPNDWLQYFITIDSNDLNNFPDGLNNQNISPKSLKMFQKRLQLLKPSIILTKIDIVEASLKRMSPKKSHEILRLSKLISETCVHSNTVLINFGSGLGYLSELLYKMNKFKILGLECDPQRVELATKRQTEHYPESMSHIVYKEERITSNSAVRIETAIQKSFPKSIQNPRSIIGLHACADLSITAIELFLHSDQIRKLIIMPCCYHKLELSKCFSNGRLFKNFPLSSSFSKAVGERAAGFEILNRPFLRLACQETVSRWRDMSRDDHRKHGNDMFLRGLVECVTREDEIVSKIKGNYTATNSISFVDVTSRYQLKSKSSNQELKWTESARTKLMDLVAEYPNGGQISEGLTCLQTALQAFCENVVLYDRICFIQEYAEIKGANIIAEVKRIFDDKLSPRCFAFVAEKSSP